MMRSMNILTDIVPAHLRKYVYALYALVAIVTGALNVAGVDTGATAEVLAYVGGALGLVAASNTEPVEHGDVNFYA